MSEVTAIDVKDYHEQTKHRFTGLARGPDTLDWDAQPVAFRRFEGAALTRLPLAADHYPLPFSALFAETGVPAQPLNMDNIGLMLEMSMAVSAWKEYGSARWALRCNPSSGNLHPTEAYLITQGIADLDDGIYHYRADEHGLEQRCRFSNRDTPTSPSLLLGLSSVHWREAWKYGERAYRYCQLDVGHAVATVSYAAAALGWRATPHYGMGDDELAQLLGINRIEEYPKGSEQEHPDLLIQLHPTNGNTLDIPALMRRLEQADWFGRANVLDRRHFYHWPIINQVTAAAHRPTSSAGSAATFTALPSPLPHEIQLPAATLFRQRRSAQAFDGITEIPQKDFYRALDHMLPREGVAPWNTQPWQPRIHLVLFVHRVEGLEPGIYALSRSAETVEQLKTQMNPQFQWQTIATAPAHLPLYLLMPGKVEGTAMKLSCGQSIAGNSAFSLAMLADYEANLKNTPWHYRELHWEAGAIGQVLYLEAEASGLQGTGIGCFFDDGVHELLGIEDTTLQVVYHFTVGKGLLDDRISTLPAYDRDRD